MILNRIIPTLLLDEKKLVKTKKFKNPTYIGDPKNTIRLFNEMNCSEIILLDISLTKKNEKINFKYLEDIITEAFMPVSYGGGVKTLEDINNLIKIGCEKISINQTIFKEERFLIDAVEKFGSSTIIVSLDVIKKNNDLLCFDYIKKNITNKTIEQRISELNKYNIGEYLINFVDKDGTMLGYDKKSIPEILKMTSSQVTFCGGAASYKDILDTLKCGAKSLAIGSLFIYQGPDSGVLINYPDEKEFQEMLSI